MPLIKTRPTSPGRRFVIKVTKPELHKGAPHGPLVVNKNRTDGRNHYGRVTVRNRGGGHKKLYRLIDFKRDKEGIAGQVERLEYDPNRSAYIALILYADGERRYIIAPKDLRVGDKVFAGKNAPIKPGNCLPLENIPLGSNIYGIELKPGYGAQLVRSAGGVAQLVAREEGYAVVRLRSGEMRKILVTCRACIGEVSNAEHNLVSYGKAGATRWRGKRPHVRGTAMNPVDHPHGGGEGRTKGGRHPVSPWGVPTKGYKTRKNKRTQKMIIKDRRE
jgi:large subunit ribosomal protein L2